MNSLKKHIQNTKFDAYIKRIEVLKKKVATTAQRVADTVTTWKNQVPAPALITLWEYRIIPQDWLSKLAPLDGFFEEGQSFNPSVERINNTKRQCWIDDGIYRYNQVGSDWILWQLGANTLEYDTIIQLYETAPGKNNADKMKSMGVIATGYRDAGDSRVASSEFAFLRSRSKGGLGNTFTALLHPDWSDVDFDWFKPSTGLVLFGVMKKKVSV